MEATAKSGLSNSSIGNHPSQSVRYVDVRSKVRCRCRERNSYLKLCWDGNRHHLAFPFDLKEMATRLQTIEVMGKKIRILSTEDLILVLCERSTRRAWQALGSIADIAWLSANSRELNWYVMMERAKRYGSPTNAFSRSVSGSRSDESRSSRTMYPDE